MVGVVAHSARAQEDESKDSVGVTILRYGAIVFLILMSGLFSGLTLGLLGLDTNQLEIVAEAGLPAERIAAQKIYPIRKKGNLLLCTLLLGNVAVNALLSILLADLTSGLVGFLLSTILIVIFGEIVPQALCSRHALALGSRAIPIVKVLIVLFYVVAWPISRVLDCALGQEIGTYYSKDEFMKLLTLHKKTDRLNKNEVDIMSGAMGLQAKSVADIYTPLNKCFTVKASDKLDYTLMADIFRSGHSRIPVWDDSGTDVVGLLFSKDLILIVPAQCVPVITVVKFFHRDRVMKVFDDDNLDELLKQFQENKLQLAIVQTIVDDGPGDPFYQVSGLVTLEDLMEEILQREIVDEHDEFESNTGAKRVGRTEYDYAHLRLLDASHGYNDLSQQEIRAMAAHLSQNVKAFKSMSFESVEELVKGSRVMDIVPPPAAREGDDAAAGMRSPGGSAADHAPDALIYERGRVDTVCTVIISGKVEVLSGNDEIRSEVGAWEVLAERALLLEPGKYEPDFNARRVSSLVRCLRITQPDFVAASAVIRPHSVGGAPKETPVASGTATGLISRQSFGSSDQGIPDEAKARAGIDGGLGGLISRKTRTGSAASASSAGADASAGAGAGAGAGASAGAGATSTSDSTTPAAPAASTESSTENGTNSDEVVVDVAES